MDASLSNMKRILTGIQPTGTLHLGNYFGAMRPAIALQAEGEAFYFIADYHALTTVQDPANLREYNRGVALDFLACGLDPARACFFLQSDVPQVTELAWILSTVTPMGLLERATIPTRTRSPTASPPRTGSSPIPCSWPPTSCSTTATWCPSARTRSSTWK